MRVLLEDTAASTSVRVNISEHYDTLVLITTAKFLFIFSLHREIRCKIEDHELAKLLVDTPKFLPDHQHLNFETPLYCREGLPGAGLVQQVSPSLCQTLQLSLDLLSVLSVRCGCDPLAFSSNHLHRWPAVI